MEGVFEMPVKVSWATLIAKLEKEETFKVSANKRKTIAPIISREIKLKYPDREYKTDIKSSPGILIVKRIK